MRINKEIPVFGDQSFRGECPSEIEEQAAFYAWLKYNHQDIATTMIHPKTEGKRTWGQIHYEEKAGGLPTGASDIIIPGAISFVVELKRKDHTKSKWQPSQQPFLLQAKKQGCFVGLALGADGLKEAFLQWHGIITDQKSLFQFITIQTMRNG